MNQYKRQIGVRDYVIATYDPKQFPTDSIWQWGATGIHRVIDTDGDCLYLKDDPRGKRFGWDRDFFQLFIPPHSNQEPL